MPKFKSINGNWVPVYEPQQISPEVSPETKAKEEAKAGDQNDTPSAGVQVADTAPKPESKKRGRPKKGKK